MRGEIEHLPSPHPLAETLPSVLRSDAFACSLCARFDDVLAPAILSLDTFVDYLDPLLTPEDMVPWLAQWLGLDLVSYGARSPHRHELQLASSLNAIRGTRRSIQLVIENVLGIPVEVLDSGGAQWNPAPGGELPGLPEPSFTVVVHPPPGVEVDLDQLHALIRTIKPVHVQHTVSVAT